MSNNSKSKYFFIKFLNEEERDMMLSFLQKEKKNMMKLFFTEKITPVEFKKMEDLKFIGISEKELYLGFYVVNPKKMMTIYSICAWIAFQSNYRLEIDRHNHHYKNINPIKISKNALPPTTGSENPYSIPIFFENDKMMKVSVNHFLQNTDSISVNQDGIITKKNRYNFIIYYIFSHFFYLGPDFNLQRKIFKEINSNWEKFQLETLKISSSRTFFSL